MAREREREMIMKSYMDQFMYIYILLSSPSPSRFWLSIQVNLDYIFWKKIMIFLNIYCFMCSTQVLIVDDGSTDRTSKVAFSFVRKYKIENVRVILLGKNHGKGEAIRKVSYSYFFFFSFYYYLNKS